MAHEGYYSTSVVFADENGNGFLDLCITAMHGENSLYMNDVRNKAAPCQMFGKFSYSCMAVDLSRYGVRVNAIAPGFIDSPMLQKAFSSDPDHKCRVLERTPMNRLGHSEDVTNATIFLASNASKFITGVNLPVDGGNSIGF